MPALHLRRKTKIVQRYVEPLPLTEGEIPLALILIPGGTFRMGSPEDEESREPWVKGSETLHPVEVPSFAMGQYPVTQAQWRAVAVMPKRQWDLTADPSHFKGANQPVEQVSWNDAVEFCARLAAQTGQGYRLPTEAEWEYACRAKTETPFHFGETLSPEVANYNCSVTYGERGVAGEKIGQTTSVDHYKIANRFGLSDMHGNVWEWCQDDWHRNYEDAPADGSAWINEHPSSFSLPNKVLRGGSWLNYPWRCRSAFRNHVSRDVRIDYISFRVACPAPRALAL
jgi:formylglycine-generating enzyme required for sulfatase activity